MQFNVSSKVLALLAITGAQICWGMQAPIAKHALEGGVNGVTIAFLRFCGTAILLWLCSLWLPAERIRPLDYVKIFVAGLFYIVLNQGCFVIGLQYTSPIDASVLSTSLPIITIVLAYVVLHTKITVRKVTGIIIGGIGAVLLIFANLHAQNATVGGSWIGNTIIVCSQLSVAIYLVCFQGLLHRYHVLTLLRWMFLFSAISFFPFAIGPVWQDIQAHYDLRIWLEVAYCVIFGTTVAYLLIIYSQQYLAAEVVSIFNYLQPLVTALLATCMGMSDLTVQKLGVIALIIIGVVLVTSKGKTHDK